MKHKVGALILLLLLLGTGFRGVQAQTYGATYVSTLTYQNLSADPNTVEFRFYAVGSSTPITYTTVLSGNGSSSLNIGNVNVLSAGFRGSAVISPTQPLAVVLVQLPPGTSASKTRPLATGFSSGSSTVLIPTALKNSFSISSIIAVQNTDSVDNNFSVTFYPVGSTTPAFVTATTNIAPGAAVYYDLGQMDGLGNPFNGSAVVQATKSAGGSAGSAVAMVDELGTSPGSKYAAAFEGAASGGTTVYMPSAMCNFGAAQITSFYAVQNTSSSTTATVVTTFSPGGVQQTVPIGPYGKVSINACNAGNASGWLGAATITASQPVIAIGKVGGGGLSTAFNGFTSGVKRIVLPYVRWAKDSDYNVSNSTKQRTFLTIQNVGITAVSPITVTYYTASGTAVETHVIAASLAPGGKVNSNPNVNHPTNTIFEFGYAPFGGSAIVEGPAGSQLAVVVRAQNYVTYSSEIAGEDYNGIPLTGDGVGRIYVPMMTRP